MSRRPKPLAVQVLEANRVVVSREGEKILLRTLYGELQTQVLTLDLTDARLIGERMIALVRSPGTAP